jgi:hypothetical protein
MCLIRHGEVTRRRQQFDELMQQVEALQHAEAERIGLTKVLQEGTLQA